MRKAFFKIAVSGVMAGSLLSVTNLASADESRMEQAKEDYVNYCASCHGVSGKGDGPLAGELKKKPSDLTKLTSKSGHFPYLKIRQTIEGSDTPGSIRSHGTSQMPVWGDVFRKKSGMSPWSESQAKTMNIVDYLASIQK